MVRACSIDKYRNCLTVGYQYFEEKNHGMFYRYSIIISTVSLNKLFVQKGAFYAKIEITKPVKVRLCRFFRICTPRRTLSTPTFYHWTCFVTKLYSLFSLKSQLTCTTVGESMFFHYFFVVRSAC